MRKWKEELLYDPIPALLDTENEAIQYFVDKDLLDKKVDSIESLWKISSLQKVLNKQQEDGAWKYPSKKNNFHTQQVYNSLATYTQLRDLIEKYGLTRSHQSIEKAAEFILSFQTKEGDIRGIYGNQYSPNYTAGMIELLIKTGYETDLRIKKALDWLLSVRQDDGGWAIPNRTHSANWRDVINIKEVLEPIRDKPSSYMVTGVVLRAFAAHSVYRKIKEINKAGKFLISGFFKKDKYPDRKDKSYWMKFTFPFWFTDFLSALDSLYFIGFDITEQPILNVIEWFKNEQQEDGLWNLKLLRPGGEKDIKHWISYVVCRTFKRYFN
ncbi:MAG: prenyltransferase/squalene oxidase repeat-containing protein [Candidatus Thorarchaeota archaeon]